MILRCIDCRRDYKIVPRSMVVVKGLCSYCREMRRIKSLGRKPTLKEIMGRGRIR